MDLFSYSTPSVFLLRLVLGIILIVHGWPKISDPQKNAKNFDGMGFKPGALWGTIAALLEFVGGIAMIIGFLVGLISLFLAIQFVVIIIWKISKKMPFVHGWEFDLLILAVILALVGSYGYYY